jgi:phage replication initiation protein
MDPLLQQSDDFHRTAPGSDARTAASAPPAQPNGGGTATAESNATEADQSDAPRLVTRGESSWGEVTGDDGERYIAVIERGRPRLISIPQPKSNGSSSAALVDYLNCSFPFSERESLADFFHQLLAILGNAFAPIIDRGCGKYGYQYSFKLGESKALFAYGGNGATGFLSFSGESCHQIPDWPRLVNYLSNIRNAHITRWDGAHDDFEGIHSVDDALRMYQAGLFINGGRNPSMDNRGNWIEPDGRGRTLYIGSSDNGKLLRVYEKGMQLGIPWHPWVRWECQLGSTDRIIPWEAVLEPGKYLAGCYPKALGWISEQQSRIRTLQKTAAIGYESLSHWCSVAYGKHIDLMLQVEGTPEKVVDKLRRPGLPSRLDLPVVPGHGKVLP